MNWRRFFAAVLLTTVAAAQGESTFEERYVNRKLGFQLAYPARYKLRKELRFWKGRRNLANICAETQGNDSCIKIFFDQRRFDLETLRRYYPPTGMDDYEPAPHRVGRFTFYYYGPGGGGVCYPDTYYVDLNDRILIISFDGLCGRDNTPMKEIKRLEPEILNSFRLLSEH